MTYEGWTNYDTWNVSLWINNEKHLYDGAVDFMKNENPLLIGKNDNLTILTSEPSGFMNLISKPNMIISALI